MKSITVRFLGATNNLPARLVASDMDGNRVIVPAGVNTHADAARALCDKLEWAGTLAQGSGANGSSVFVFVTPVNTFSFGITPAGKPDLVLPTIHLNGSSGDRLLEDTMNARAAVREAETALLNIAPHPRDYYVNRDAETTYKTACSQYRGWALALHSVSEDLDRYGIGIADRIAARSRNS